jgi:hypothetical protein
MVRSISIVEYKVMQAEFFLSQIRGAGFNLFVAQCFTDAFTSSARSITFAMQSVLADLPGFNEWYAAKQAALRRDPVAQFFSRYRSTSAHIGETPVRAGASGKNSTGVNDTLYYFLPTADLTEVPEGDVFSVCSTYFKAVLSIVFESFSEFRQQLDDRWYYTKTHFDNIGKTVEDAEEELGFPRGYTAAIASGTDEERFRVLRMTQTVGCQINDIFREYLGRVIDGPDGLSQEET